MVSIREDNKHSHLIVDEYIIRLFGFVEYDDGGFHPWTWNSTTVFQDTISEVYVRWDD